MNTFQVVRYDRDSNKTQILREFSSKANAVDYACCYMDDRYEGDFDGDSEKDVKCALMERGFYVVGYGETEISINEI